MPNSRYESGRRFEYAVKKDLEERGYFCTRSSGSHGAVDIVAIGEYNILLIQCKTGGVMTKKDKDGLLSAAKHDCTIPIVAEKGTAGRKSIIKYSMLTDSEEREWRWDEPTL